MLVTIAICTRNRAESLRRTLDSLAALQIPGDVTWEIVIVHNSTDHTDKVIGEYLDRLPVRKELETQAGLSNARNQAIDAAKGEYIIWTDDDVIVGPGWLSAYVEAFRRWPEAAVFDGRIKPKYEPPVTRWIAEAEALLVGPLAIRDFGERVQPLSVAGYRIPFGANFAIRTKEQRAFRYDRNLGAAPNRPRSDDEVDVITRLLESGATGYWIPDAAVEHCIGQDRQTLSYIASTNAMAKPGPFVPPKSPLKHRFGLGFRDGYGRGCLHGGSYTGCPGQCSQRRLGQISKGVFLQ